MIKKGNNEIKEGCLKNFDENLLSGYLDEELTQSMAQRVQIHIEDCPVCRKLFDDMKSIREVSMTTNFVEPKTEDWNENPVGPASKTARFAGWTLLITWLTAIAVYGTWQFLTGPEKLLDKILVFGVVAGVVLLFVSVLLDRIRLSKTDRYKGVQK